MDDVKGICDIIKNTVQPDQFIGQCLALQDFTGNTLDPYIKHDLVESLLKIFISNDPLKRFTIRPGANLNMITTGLKKVCLDTLSTLVVSNLGFERINKQLKNELERKLFTKQIKEFYDIKDNSEHNVSLIISVYCLLTNICIFEPNNIDLYELKYIVGDENFSCLDSKMNPEDNNYSKLLLKRTMLAFNYYLVGLNSKNLESFVTAIEKRKSILNKEIRVELSNLIMISMKALKDTSMKRRVKKLIK
jgi:hypothetical protein